MKNSIRFWSYLAHFFSEWEMFRTKAVEKIKTHILFIYFPPPPRKSFRVGANVEKCRVGDATDNNMAHAHTTLGTWGYKPKLAEYVTIIAFLLQQWLHGCASLLRYSMLHALLYMFSSIKCKGTVQSQFGERIAFGSGNSEHGGTTCKKFTCSSQYLLYSLRKAYFYIFSINVIAQAVLSSTSRRACPRSLSQQSTRDLWWAEWHRDRRFIDKFSSVMSLSWYLCWFFIYVFVSFQWQKFCSTQNLVSFWVFFAHVGIVSIWTLLLRISR